MIYLSKVMFILIMLFLSSILYAKNKDCPEKHALYAPERAYHIQRCSILVHADSKDFPIDRIVTFTKTSYIPFFVTFANGKITNSIGERGYYIFPIRSEEPVPLAGNSHLTVTHQSGVRFNFDENGKISSPDIKMKVSNEINSSNKAGVEIESYQHGIVIDLGYKMGDTPITDKNANFIVTDKNKKKCTFKNTEFHRFNNKDDEAELIYKTNESLHEFLAKKCPQLDISDLIKPFDHLEAVSRPSDLGLAPAAASNANEGLKIKNNDADAKAKFLKELIKNPTQGRATQQ